ncbi:hypothetical protein ACWGB8_30925 [Kitasatospora sp. NPDC054939]
MNAPVFAIRYDNWFVPIAWTTGLTRRRSTVTLTAGTVEIRMGWAFRAAVPRRSVLSAGPDRRSVFGWGVHGFGGYWLVNGSSHGIVALETAPDTRCRVMGLPLRLRELRISLDRPDDFLAALGAERARPGQS